VYGTSASPRAAGGASWSLAQHAFGSGSATAAANSAGAATKRARQVRTAEGVLDALVDVRAARRRRGVHAHPA
jgi:hypothetical protein